MIAAGVLFAVFGVLAFVQRRRDASRVNSQADIDTFLRQYEAIHVRRALARCAVCGDSGRVYDLYRVGPCVPASDLSGSGFHLPPQTHQMISVTCPRCRNLDGQPKETASP